MFRIAYVSLPAAVTALPAPSAVPAEGYPQKPIRFVLPFAPGGGTDVLARALSSKLEEVLGASVIIDNRPGAGGTLGTAVVARAAPDGYTLLFTFIARVYRAAARVLKDPEIAKRLAAEGAIAVGNSPAEFEAFVRTEIAAWRKLIREMKL